MKIAIVTNRIYDPIPFWVEKTDYYKKQYCDKWKMDYVCTERNPFPHLHPQWCKPQILLDVMPQYDWIVWIDADATIVGMNFNLGKYLVSCKDDKIIMAKDVNGWNSGVFAIPNRKRSVEWLEHINSLREDPRFQEGWHDQVAMVDSFEHDWSDIVIEPPQEIGWNQYLDMYEGQKLVNRYKKGHWCLHLPAMSTYLKDEIFRNRLWVC